MLSPAAYYTDILHFLAQRPAKGGRSAKDVLFARRPGPGRDRAHVCEHEHAAPVRRPRRRGARSGRLAGGFTLAATLAGGLDGASVTTQLRSAFTAQGYLLSADATALVSTAGQRWYVRDGGLRFRIERSGASLKATVWPQTSSPAAQLRANPEHLNSVAYAKLATAVYPWTLPLDLPSEEARLFLEHLGVPRHELVRRFRGPAAAATRAAELVGLTDAERRIVVGAHTLSASPWRFWGFASAGTWTTDLQTVKTLLRRADFHSDDLLELLRLHFVNPGGTLAVKPAPGVDAATCDPAELRVQGLAAADLDRLQRFVRLSRRLGWNFRELDKALTTLQPAGLDDDLVVMLADVEALRRRFALPVDELLAWYGPIDTAAYAELADEVQPSVYERLFQNPAVVKRQPGEADPFALNAQRTELATVRSLVAQPTDSQATRDEIAHLRAAVSGALRVSAEDLTALVEGPDAVVTAAQRLDLENLSRLFRHASLARALKLPVRDLVTLIGLTGVDPFVAGGAAVTPVDTARAERFLEHVANVRASGPSVAALAYILHHAHDPKGKAGHTDDAVAALAERLRTGLKAIVADTTPGADPGADETANDSGSSAGATRTRRRPLAFSPGRGRSRHRSRASAP